MKHVDYLIVGAGPTGLGAAYRFKELGVSSFLVLEATETVGGLSASFRDKSGFSWDVGGHVLFSKNNAFIRLMNRIMGADLLCHHRRARVCLPGGWTDYPFQDHIHQLDGDLAQYCRKGLEEAPGPGEKTQTFEDWIRHSFGAGISELFMEPYNRKLWSCSLQCMGYNWVQDRISHVRGARSQHFHSGKTDSGWGPNNRFHYPRNDGIGAIFKRMAQGVREHIRFQHEVVELDLQNRMATTSTGHVYGYKFLMNTAPLDRFINELARPGLSEVRRAANRLVHNSVSVIGLGVDVPGDRCTSWMYFPDPGIPYYRLTHLHNYASDITPCGDVQSALLMEIASPGGHRKNLTEMIPKVVSCLADYGLLNNSGKKKIVSNWKIYAPYGYPVPTLDRDHALSIIQPFLESHHVYSRGRFGGWKYEAGNMDHSVMQGIEWAERMTTGAAEKIYRA